MYEEKVEKESIVQTFRGIAQSCYSISNMKKMLFEYLDQIEGATENEVLVKVSGFLDYPHKEALFRLNSYNYAVEDYQLMFENSKKYYSNEFWGEVDFPN